MVSMALPLTSNKMYILDKYFSEMQKVWRVEDLLQASSSASKDMKILKEHLKSLNTELVSLQRNLEPNKNNSTKTTITTTTNKTSEPARSNSKTDIRNSYGASNLTLFKQVEDLIKLPGPLTEHSLLKTLQARFYNGQFYTYCGPVLVTLNPHRDVPGPRALLDTRPACRHLREIVHTVTRQHVEHGHSQVIVLSGCSGSGKTSTSMVLLRQLFEVAGGGPETDSFKHLSAAVTVLRSLSCASTRLNPESSRLGFFIENQVADGAVHRTKIHCYFLDSSRIAKLQTGEKNYHIFYQMFAGLTQEERLKLHLQGYSVHNLSYLSCGDTTQNDVVNKARFEAWKSALSVMGIPFSDVMRVLAAVLLLGNIHLVDGPGLELEVQGNNEIKAVSALLGVSSVALYRGLSTRTRSARGQIFKSMADANSANNVRDALAKALFCRTVSAIVKRANSMKRPNSNSTISTDSNESFSNDHNGFLNMNGSMFLKTSPSASRSSMNQLNNNQDGFIGILDMFGFENMQTNHLEQICVNLCSETLQHFYNTRIFRNASESCAEEGIQSDMDVSYHDNLPVIDLLSSKKMGILSLLDTESNLQRTETEAFIQKMLVQHKLNPSFSECTTKPSMFSITHYVENVEYDTSQLLLTNRDHLPDDIVFIFAKQNCNFGFVSHLFSSELKALQENGVGSVAPRGVIHRICPCPNADMQSSVDGRGTTSLDFRSRLDSLMKTLSHARPHFVRCIKSNNEGHADQFDRETVVKQVRALQLLETTNLLAGGFPHKMRYRAFNSRYNVILNIHPISRHEDRCYEICKMILDHFVKTMENMKTPCSSSSWAVGKKHIFLSEIARQQLEGLRDSRLTAAAKLIQTAWRRHTCMKNWPALRMQLDLHRRSRATNYQLRPRHGSQSSTHTANRQISIGSVKSDLSTNREPVNRSRHSSGGGDLTMNHKLKWQDLSSNHHNGFLSDTELPPYNRAVHSLNRAASFNHTTYTSSHQNEQANHRHKAEPALTSRNRSNSVGHSTYAVIGRNGDLNGPVNQCDQQVLQQTANHYGVDIEKPPPVPPNRPYTVQGNIKLGFPQLRTMRQIYKASGPSGDQLLFPGQQIKIVNMSPRRGYLLVEIEGSTVDVPYHVTELQTPKASNPVHNPSLSATGIDI